MNLKLKKLSHQVVCFFCLLFSSAVFACEKPTVIDIGFVYDSRTKNGIEARINSFINDTNNYLRNSKVCMAVRSVGSIQAKHDAIVGTHSNGNKEIQLNGQGDLDYMRLSDYITDFRNRVGADLVHGLFDVDWYDLNLNNYCGRAYLTLTKNKLGDEALAYAVTRPMCGSLTFAHEVGHNLGLEHDIIKTPDRSNLFVPYAIGHGVPYKFGTIMSYSLLSFKAIKIGHFSNPSVLFKGLTTFFKELPTGVENQADSARALQQSKYIVSKYRPFKTPFLRSNSTIDYRIRSITTGKCVDVAGFSQSDGGNLHQWDCTGNPNQVWRVDFDGVNQNYVFRSRNSGLCLATSGNNVVQKNCNNYVDDSVRWKLSLRYGGGYDVESVAQPGRFLAVSGGNKGANMVLAQGVPSNDGTFAGHRFHFEAYNFANRSTEPNDWGVGNAFFLDRHEIDCSSYGINQFRLNRPNLLSIQYQYQCARTPSHQAIERYTNLNDAGPLNIGFASARYLDRHNIECDGRAIKKIKLDRSGNQWRYRYACDATPVQNEKQYSTPWNHLPWRGDSMFLDRHNVSCPSGQVLTQAKLESKQIDQGFWTSREVREQIRREVRQQVQVQVQERVRVFTSWIPIPWLRSWITQTVTRWVTEWRTFWITEWRIFTETVWVPLAPKLEIRYVYECGSYPPNSIIDLTDINFSTSDSLLQWSDNGPIGGLHCAHINEPADSQTWRDNYLCSTEDLGMRWSYSGPINNMQCTRVYEGSANGWNDNFLCLPNNSDSFFSWHIGSTNVIESNKRCVNLREPSKPPIWQDNYLCYNKKPLYVKLFDQYGSSPRTLLNETEKVLLDNGEKQRLVESLFNQESSLDDQLKLVSFFNVLFSAEQYYAANSASRNRLIEFVHEQVSHPKFGFILHVLALSRTGLSIIKTTLDFFKASKVPVLVSNADSLITTLTPIHINMYKKLFLEQSTQNSSFLALVLRERLRTPDGKSKLIAGLNDDPNSPFYDKAITIKFLNYLFNQDLYQPLGIDPDSILLKFALEHENLALSLAEQAINSGNTSGDISELLSNLIQRSSTAQVVDRAKRLKTIIVLGSNDCVLPSIMSMGIYQVFVDGICK